MAEELITRTLLGIKRCLERSGGVLPESAEALKKIVDAQDIVSLNLQRAVQLCVDVALNRISALGLEVPDTMAGAFVVLGNAGKLPNEVVASMRAAVGFRTLSVHQYDEIDWDIVYMICTKHLPDLKRFASMMAN